MPRLMSTRFAPVTGIPLAAGLSNREYNVLHERFLNATEGAPECFTIQKQRTAR